MKQSEQVDAYCQDLFKISRQLTGFASKISEGDDYREMMSYQAFNTATEKTLKHTTECLQEIMTLHPKLKTKMTVNEKVRPTDDDVVSHVVDFLLEVVELEELEGQMRGKIDTSKSVTNKPQTKFTDKPDNFATTYTPKCLKKYHSDYPVNTVPHPYINEIRNLQLSEWQKVPCNPQAPLSFENTPLLFVQNMDELNRLIKTLNNVDQFAVDVEHHSEHSYNGFACLMQISTRSEDFVVDVITLRDSIHLLNEPFTNPKIEKVFHGCDFDMVWLSYNFGLYVVNNFDSGQAARCLKLQHFSLKFLLEKYVGVEADKKYQLADWRIRPLTQEMINYARGDTHYLLYICDLMRNECLEQNVLYEVQAKSNELCLRLFKPTIYNDAAVERIAKKSWIKKSQFKAFKKLFLLRDKIAREEDESPHSIMSQSVLNSILSEVPTDFEKLKMACLPKIPYFVEMHSMEIINLMKEEMAEVKKGAEEQLKTQTTVNDSVKFVETTLEDGYERTVIRSTKDFISLFD
ncbi:exosome complex exonuclease RRP6, putative [Entamoeba invadens IP1]|uniref:exosome complex exonuclease RRP6, putative n=1 Tax=Entamoeba invadens IP1 TaxID=370355 RepID=UPI0002C3DC9E|nr:exosome complex exonuclease RRP6, putative [Entamoeba invadens IP1]ELP85248.1 exosome complex exonuclease RRP6, putative [Entamoeba invadens IP1]|eukprot:XP_004184594.1 exosome complex exonuclease RRP6, putative [Entamoeba invadens IP1]